MTLDTTEAALALEQNIKHTPASSVQSNTFQAHIVDVTSPDDVIPALKALAADVTIGGAVHMSYAYRIGNEASSIQNWEDDGEYSGGRTIMNCIQEKNTYNKLVCVCVSRWYARNKGYMGKPRLETIRKMAKEAIDIGQGQHLL
jgi:hypothetical protein